MRLMTTAQHPTRHTWVLLLTTTANVNLAFRHLLLAEGRFAFSVERACQKQESRDQQLDIARETEKRDGSAQRRPPSTTAADGTISGSRSCIT
ncbi:hypothetical protein JB92DRAFT_2898994 [Gautieria morchelliformis]|nr:hypothetical protein JB92DRAFT_2898994 [Gautieria morchelliformis]